MHSAQAPLNNTAAQSPSQYLRVALLGLAAGELHTATTTSLESWDALPHTMLALYTADGILDAVQWAGRGQPADEIACLWLSYLRWLQHQGLPAPTHAPPALPRWIDEVWPPTTQPHRGTTDTIQALLTGEMGQIDRPVSPQAQGDDVLLRSVPIGCLPLERASVAIMAHKTAAITHGNSQAQASAVCAAVLVHEIMLASDRSHLAPIQNAIQNIRDHAESVDQWQPHMIDVLGHLREQSSLSTKPLSTYPTATQTLVLSLRAALATEQAAVNGAQQTPAAIPPKHSPAVTALWAAIVNIASASYSVDLSLPENHLAVKTIEHMAACWSQEIG